MPDAYDYAASRLARQCEDQIAKFWARFESHAESFDRCFSEGVEFDVPKAVDEAMSHLPGALMWEFGPSDKGHALKLTAEDSYELRPLARAVVANAPELPRWVFSDVRGPEPVESVIKMLEARRQRPTTIEAVDVDLDVDRSIALNVLSASERNEAISEGLILFSVLFGETVERNWLGTIDVSQPKRKLFGRRKPQQIDVAALQKNVVAKIDEAKGLRPSVRFDTPATEDTEMTLLKPGASPAAWPREDLIVLSTRYTELEKALLDINFFASERFSAFGETFVIVQIARTDDRFDQVDARYDIEDAVGSDLATQGLGAVISGGHGAENVYLTIALGDVETGVATVSETLQRANVAHEAWIHFPDQGLQDFTVPIWPDGPTARHLGTEH